MSGGFRSLFRLARMLIHRHFQLLLFSAERALAHSHELKAILTRPNPANGISKKDQLSWLRRALKYSTSLHSIASDFAAASPPRITQTCLSEITVYHLSLVSELSFERGNWGETITSLAVRRRLLLTFAEAARDSYDQALEFMDAYDPLIRFAAYKLGRAESHDIAGVVGDVDGEMQDETLPGVEALVEGLRNELGSQEVEEGRRKLENVKFAGEAIEMRSAEMVGMMTKVQAAMEGLEGKGRGMRSWDRVLGVLGEAEGVAKKLVDDHEVGAGA
jgi:signal recognition particle subunit SRP68